MPGTEFLNRVVSRIDKIDRKGLEDYVLDLVRQTKFLTYLLDQIREGIMVLSEKKEILLLNRRMIQLFNIPDFVVRKGRLEQAIPDERLASFIIGAMDGGRELFDEQFETLLPRPMIVRMNLIVPEQRAKREFLLTITNLSHAEMNLRERFKLENWESLLGLAAGIAHEIGNPLNSLSIHLKLLGKTVEKLPAGERKEMKASVRVIEDETKRLDGIVRNFLKATRRRPLRFEVGDMNDLLGKTISIMKPELKESKVQIREDLDKRIPRFLFDPDRMQQVFINIIKNAAHAMPKGGTLRIQSEANGKLCLIHFQDSGVGIPEASLPRIFDAYYTTKEEGSGLGLMIVYQIIREHGGRMEVSSKRGVGTTFTVVLPIRSEKLGLPEPAERIK